MLSQSKQLTAAMRSVHARSFFSFLKGGGGNTSPPASLEGKVCWVVGGVDTVSGGAQSSFHDAFADAAMAWWCKKGITGRSHTGRPQPGALM